MYVCASEGDRNFFGSGRDGACSGRVSSSTDCAAEISRKSSKGCTDTSSLSYSLKIIDENLVVKKM